MIDGTFYIYLYVIYLSVGIYIYLIYVCINVEGNRGGLLRIENDIIRFYRELIITYFLYKRVTLE